MKMLSSTGTTYSLGRLLSKMRILKMVLVEFLVKLRLVGLRLGSMIKSKAFIESADAEGLM